MAFKKITQADTTGKWVVGLPDTPGLNTAEMQAKFDEISRDVVIPAHNELVDQLEAADGSAGGNIKVVNPKTSSGGTLNETLSAIEQENAQNTQKAHTHDNKSVLDAITSAVKTGYDRLVTLLTGITGIDSSVTSATNKLPTSKAVKDKTDTMQTEITANTNARHTHSNKSVLDAISSSAKAGYDRLVTLFSSITGIATTVTNTHAKIPDCAAIVSYVSQLGGGDMLKAVYDADDNGIVDKAENAMTTVEQDDSLAIAPTSAGNALPLTIYGQSTQNGTPTPSAAVAIDSAIADFKCVGKNLNAYPYYETTKTVNGITFIDNGDGSVTVSGIASADVTFRPHMRQKGENNDFKLENGNYIFTGCPSGGSSSSYLIIVYRTDENNTYKEYGRDYGEGLSFTVNGDYFSTESANIGIDISIKSGQDFTTPKTFYPMIRLASVADATYEPYKHTDITTDLTLRAIEVTSSDPYNLVKDGKYYIADTIDWDEVDGYQITRRIKEVIFNGSEAWTRTANNCNVEVNDYLKQPATSMPYVRSTQYKPALRSTGTNDDNYISALQANEAQNLIFIRDTTHQSSLSDFTTWLSNNNLTVMYALREHTTEAVSSAQAKALLSMRTYDESTSIDAVNATAPVLELEYAKTRTPALALTGHNMAHINAIDIGDM